jgi:capsular polysaccharide biosynthesis protein
LIDALRDLFQVQQPNSPGTRKLWISRKDAASRKPQWEQEFLKQLGDFESVYLSELSPAEQIRTMSQARIIAAPHGAGLSNIIFCCQGTHVIEIFPDIRRQPVYRRLAETCGLNYSWALADFEAASPPGGLPKAVCRVCG